MSGIGYKFGIPLYALLVYSYFIYLLLNTFDENKSRFSCASHSDRSHSKF